MFENYKRLFETVTGKQYEEAPPREVAKSEVQNESVQKCGILQNQINRKGN